MTLPGATLQAILRIMALDAAQPRRKVIARRIRVLLYLLILAGVAAWRFMPRPWHPAITLEMSHHIIFSSATRSETEDTAHVLELL